MKRYFVTSDLHFGHNKSFLYEPRGFDNIYDHDEAIIKNWNSVVEDEDTVFVLGDIMLNDNEYGCKCFNQLRGSKEIILGNHDTRARIELYKNLSGVLNIVYADILNYNDYSFYLSHYPTITSNHDDTKKTLKHRIVNLCGHTHTNNKFHDLNKGLIYHCELDAHNMTPVSIDTIIEDLKNEYYR